jgi:hypothetical protein
VPNKQRHYTILLRLVKVNVSGLDAGSYRRAESSFASLRSLRTRILVGYSVCCGIAGEPWDQNRAEVKQAHVKDRIIRVGNVRRHFGAELGSLQIDRDGGLMS